MALPPLPTEDRNCVGSAWKNLARWGVIQRLEGATDHRRSTAPGRKGGVVWRYALADAKLLRAFLRANGADEPRPPQKLEQAVLL